MLSIPKRLLSESFVSTLAEGPNYIFIRKSLAASMQGRPSYLSMHAISIITSGRQLLQSDDGYQIEVKAGEYSIVRKGIYTITDWLSEGQAFTAYLLFFTQPFGKALPYPSESFQTVRPFFKATQPTDLSTFLASPYFAQGTLPLDLLDTLKQNIPAAQFIQSLQHAPKRPLKSFVEAHFDKPLTIADYAYFTGQSESTFRRSFKKEFGVSPRKWLTQRRMQKASELLKEQAYSVTDAAMAVGYEHISHFIEAFKTVYGQTPKQWVMQAS